MDYDRIKKELLLKHDGVKVANYINYLNQLKTSKKKDGTLQNPWFQYKKEQELIDMFNKTAAEKIYIDGEIATIQSTGISLGYHAYKNLVLNRYPESKIDMQLVRETDEFNFQKKDGKVFYTHKLKDTFSEKKIIGAYCIIKNKLGEFIEVISLSELEKIRKIAKTDYIWRMWFSEMCLKTVIKRACKRHFRDITVKMDNIDNENYNVENPIDVELKIKQETDKIETLDKLKEYYNNKIKNVNNPKSFNKLITLRKKEISNQEAVNANI